MSLEEDDIFYCNLLSIRVENRIFKVPRELFELYSEVFRDMFDLPKSKNDVPDGERDNKPLVLEGIHKEDFRAFLTALSSLHQEAMTKDGGEGKPIFLVARLPLYHGLEKQHWIAVLRLAHMWGFDNVRKKAVEMLGKDSELSQNTLERLKLANEFFIDDWIRQACRELITRDKALSQEEAPWLGPDFLQNMAKAREERTKAFLARIISREVDVPNCPSCNREGTLRIGLSFGFETLPYFICYDPFCARPNSTRTYSLEQIMCQSVSARTKGTLITKDLDMIISKYLVAPKHV